MFNRIFGRRSKKTSKLRVTRLCEGNSPVMGEFPAQRASNAENDSIWWRHHAIPSQLKLSPHKSIPPTQSWFFAACSRHWFSYKLTVNSSSWVLSSPSHTTVDSLMHGNTHLLFRRPSLQALVPSPLQVLCITTSDSKRSSLAGEIHGRGSTNPRARPWEYRHN